ncbi:sulfotransferase, partial [Thioclava sp. BHET1]
LKPTRSRLMAFRQAYLERIARRAEGCRYVIDKLPENFKYCGLIAEAFPEARIIHLHRDARAVCWSNYRQYFTVRGLGYCYDMADTVAYHALYRGLMASWTQSYPERIHDLDYEALTEAQEPVTRRLLAALGLPWEDQCLHPEQNARAVLTASSRQVRQGVYRGSSAKWRDFQPFIGPLLEGLNEAAA